MLQPLYAAPHTIAAEDGEEGKDTLVCRRRRLQGSRRRQRRPQNPPPSKRHAGRTKVEAPFSKTAYADILSCIHTPRVAARFLPARTGRHFEKNCHAQPLFPTKVTEIMYFFNVAVHSWYFCSHSKRTCSTSVQYLLFELFTFHWERHDIVVARGK